MQREKISRVDWRRVADIVGLLVGVLVVAAFLASAVPQVVGADHSYVVQSNSMSPSIKAGAVVFVSEVEVGAVERGDVVTFDRQTNAGASRVTHRVVDVLRDGDEVSLRMKGDANEEPDPTVVDGRNLVGIVQFHVPLIGYVIAFAGTQNGVLALVVVPALVLAILELRDLWQEASDADGDSAAEAADGTDDDVDHSLDDEADSNPPMEESPPAETGGGEP